MPQFDISTYISQAFWVLLIFFCYWFIMDKFVIPKISETIEERKRKYNDFIQKAEDINQKAQASLQQYEDMLAAAKAEANEQIQATEKELSSFISQKENEIKQELNEKMTEQKAKITEEREKMLQQTDRLSSELAYIVIKKMQLSSITRADINDSITRGEM